MRYQVERMIPRLLDNDNSDLFSMIVSSYFFAFIMKKIITIILPNNKTETQILT